jgi:hypothetical protein
MRSSSGSKWRFLVQRAAIHSHIGNCRSLAEMRVGETLNSMTDVDLEVEKPGGSGREREALPSDPYSNNPASLREVNCGGSRRDNEVSQVLPLCRGSGVSRKCAEPDSYPRETGSGERENHSSQN